MDRMSRQPTEYNGVTGSPQLPNGLHSSNKFVNRVVHISEFGIHMVYYGSKNKRMKQN